MLYVVEWHRWRALYHFCPILDVRKLRQRQEKRHKKTKKDTKRHNLSAFLGQDRCCSEADCQERKEDKCEIYTSATQLQHGKMPRKKVGLLLLLSLLVKEVQDLGIVYMTH